VFLTFLLAGSSVPARSAFAMARWPVLAMASALGVAIVSRRTRTMAFDGFHLASLFVVGGLVASSVFSVNPTESLLKALGYAGLVIFSATGARLNWLQGEARFARALVLAAELLVCVSAVSYGIFSHSLYGNPNSLGALMGVFAVPVLTWAVLTPQLGPRLRPTLALVLAGALLISSVARASWIGVFLAVVLVLISARRYAPLVVGVVLLLTTILGLFFYAPSKVAFLQSEVIYKENRGESGTGMLQSREGPWQESIQSIRRHPWTGIGFGVTENTASFEGKFQSEVGRREHGSSYLAWLEGTGIIGSGILLFWLAHLFANIWRTATLVRRNRSLFYLAVPSAMIALAILAHATFEDSLVAPGYYVTVLFWIMSSCLNDSVSAARETAKEVRRTSLLQAGRRVGTAGVPSPSYSMGHTARDTGQR